jgi:transglutaminase-like putative cysteine protease
VRGEFRKSIIPLLLSAALSTLTLSLYSPRAPFFALPVLVFNYLVFLLCGAVRRQKKLGPLLYLIACLLAAALFRLAGAGDARDTLGLIYLLKSGDLPPLALLGLAPAACYFIASGVFYFTRVSGNTLMLALIVVVPYMLCASRLTTASPVYAAVIIPLFVAAVAESRRNDMARAGRFLSPRFFPLLALGALLLLAVFLLLLPESGSTPYDYFRRMYGNFENLTMQSGRGQPEARNERPLFEVRAAESLYLKRQVFGAFSRGQWNAATGEYFFTVREDWQNERAQLSVSNLLALIRQAAAVDPDFAARYGSSAPVPDPEAAALTAEIRHLGLSTAYVPHPETSFTVAGLPLNENTLQTPNGEIVLWPSRLPGDARYSLSYYRQPPQEQVLAYLSAFDYETLLSDMSTAFARGGRFGAQTAARTFGAEVEKATVFRTLTTYAVPERLERLATVLTLGLPADYAKAFALERYFHENDFVYDLDYVPPSQYRTDIEYFVFTSRRGTCSDYATAMTLLARAAGLNARYVEGFYSPPPGENGLAQVTTGSAHAYVEIFLPGYGWTVFEPTVNYTEARAEPPADAGAAWRRIALPIAAGLGGALLLLIIVRSAAGAGREALFRRRVRRTGGREGLLLLYKRTQALLSRRHRVPTAPQTPRMLAEFARSRHGVDLCPLTALYERAVFAGAPVAAEELAAALQAYVLLRRALRQKNPV